MIEESDNTATNMLIRLVGRTRINATMSELGLSRTRVGDYIRSEGDIRSLRSSPHDMTRLLEAMAQARLIDEWSSREMLAILTGQRHNGLIPAPLPKGMAIAHKTGTLHDTLNDVGIVYLRDEPYVIAVMTTHLPSLSDGRVFIRHVSSLAFTAFERFARWRENEGLPAFDGIAGARSCCPAPTSRWPPTCRCGRPRSRRPPRRPRRRRPAGRTCSRPQPRRPPGRPTPGAKPPGLGDRDPLGLVGGREPAAIRGLAAVDDTVVHLRERPRHRAAGAAAHLAVVDRPTGTIPTAVPVKKISSAP